MTMMNVPQPGQDSDGDYDAAEDLWDEANASTWSPPAWHNSPMELQNRARSANQAAYASVAANAGKHSNPPNEPWERDT